MDNKYSFLLGPFQNHISLSYHDHMDGARLVGHMIQAPNVVARNNLNKIALS